MYTSNCAVINLYSNNVPEGKLYKVTVDFQAGIYSLSWMTIS